MEKNHSSYIKKKNINIENSMAFGTSLHGKTYYPRILDSQLDLNLQAFGAVHIVGPKWCGKTTTAEQQTNSVLKFQKDPNSDNLLETAKIRPSVLLNSAKPELIDEWQDAPEIWDAVRVYCDEHPGPGHFILTGSTSKKVTTSHTGIGRIAKLRMYPMSLYESNESNGTASLKKMFAWPEEENQVGFTSQLSVDNLIFAACRGGWPASLHLKNQRAQLMIATDYFEQLCSSDIYSVDSVRRNQELMRAILRSYARNISTLAKTTAIISDVNATCSVSEITFNDYLDVLERLYVIEDLYGWCPPIRSASAMRRGRKREFIDPSLAVAALGVSPEYFQTDLKTFGFIFECLCMRDLRIYASQYGGTLSYYHDKQGLEADAVLHFRDGRYALIECKLGGYGIEEGAQHLLQLEKLIAKRKSQNESVPLRMPDVKIVLTAGKFGYRRDDGVFVVPIGCLGP